MNRRAMWMAGLTALLALGMGHAFADKGGKPDCGNHGTSVEFLDTPAEAAKQARKEGKLVFVLHVSGNFEDPRFT